MTLPMASFHRMHLESPIANKLQSAFREYNRKSTKHYQGHELLMIRPMVLPMDSTRRGVPREITSLLRSKIFKLHYSVRTYKCQHIDFGF